ncbi:glycosyltransferase family 4 protein [Geomonas nitrogeniifigens]|uniref:Glycosyltransferase family 4 protein n=1 Tax=Geomonas diazotrophica TaxID=2843197 RepID=A0ABX8JBT3_9BACT|nr:glycosyltransferase family 4 protein [Geomonas nitrogeniifigens]QWV95869.1 glycosyltransferase family 4 protein [Geomonas nitrogeniifigens]QXE84955.1 glycosyltransferase family 4 protein [Geomonas nitrogeniifigens]
MAIGLNVVFMGRFGYPSGMASTKRIQHFIDHLQAFPATTRVLQLRPTGEGTPGGQGGNHQGTEYRRIGADLKLDWRLPVALFWYHWNGIGMLKKWRTDGAMDVLYCYGGVTAENVLLIVAGKRLGYKVVFDIVEDNTYIDDKLTLPGKLKWLAGEILDRYLLGLADGVVVISSYLRSLYGKKIALSVPLCLIPISARCDLSATGGREPGPMKFVYAGSFAKKDGIELLLEAFEKVHQKKGNCQLMLCGTGGSVENYQARIAANPAIRYVGYLDDAEFYRFLQGADVLCVTRTGSTYANAGFPFKLGEYLATGNPVIVSDVGDVRRYLSHMEDAIIVEPGNAVAIAGALEYCLDHPETAAKIGQSGAAKCRQYFDPAANGRLLVELIRRL